MIKILSEKRYENYRTPILWSCAEDDDSLTCENPEGAVEDYMYQHGQEGNSKQFTVYGFARTIVEYDWDHALCAILAALDEDYGGENSTDPTPEMIEAHRIFVAAILAEYESWRCETVCDMEVEVTDDQKTLGNHHERIGPHVPDVR